MHAYGMALHINLPPSFIRITLAVKPQRVGLTVHGNALDSCAQVLIAVQVRCSFVSGPVLHQQLGL
jgi:hypothetical protein